MSKRSSRKPTDESVELLRDMLIIQLGLAKVSQENIRKIARCDMARVSRIVKLLKSERVKEGRK